MKNIKSIHLLSILFFVIFFSLGFLVTGILNTKISKQKQNTDTKAAGPIQEATCTNLGGECQAGKLNEIGKSCTLSSGNQGTVAYNLCPNQGNDIRCCVPDAAQEPTPQGETKISLSVALQGIGPNQNIQTPQRTATIKIYDDSKDFTSAAFTAQDTLSYDPTSGRFLNPDFNLGSLTAGDYQMVIQTDTYLDSELVDKSDGDVKFTIELGAKIEAAAFEMKAGDLAPRPGGDNYVNIIDYNALIGCMPGAPPSACFNRKLSDLNDDGKVDQKDLDILLLNFGENGFSFQTNQFKCEPDPACTTGKGALQLCSLLCTKKTQRG